MRAFLPILVAGALVACTQPIDEPIAEVEPDELEAAVDAAKEDLTPEERKAFEDALGGLAELEVAAALARDGLDMDKDAFMRRYAEQITGKSPREIIREHRERKIADLTRQIEQGEVALEEAKATADAVAQRQAYLDGIKVSAARYYWTEDRFSRDPAIAFTIENQTDQALRRVFFHGVVFTPGRSVPWIDEDFNYEFRGGLEPGEKTDLQLAPNQFGPWGVPETRDRDDIVMEISVVNFEDAAGERWIPYELERSIDDDRIASLTESLEDARRQLAELVEAQLE